MTRRGPMWRNRAAAELVLKHLDLLDIEPPYLVLNDSLPDVGVALEAMGPVSRWSRRADVGTPGTVWPAGGPFGGALVRIPRDRGELEMTVHAAADRLTPGGKVVLYGANDEGIRSVRPVLEPVFGDVRTAATGGRCRLVVGVRGRTPAKAPLTAWRVESPAPHRELTGEAWVSYPGVFGSKGLDPGTALLLAHAPAPDPSDDVLDFGCGSGVIAGVLAARAPGLRPWMLDVDAVALAAATENVPAGVGLCANGWSAAGPRASLPSLDLVVSNPPYHSGKAETLAIVEGLVAGSAERLKASGSLVLVAQRRFALDATLSSRFRHATSLGDAGPFRVWAANDPIRRG